MQSFFKYGRLKQDRLHNPSKEPTAVSPETDYATTGYDAHVEIPAIFMIIISIIKAAI